MNAPIEFTRANVFDVFFLFTKFGIIHEKVCFLSLEIENTRKYYYFNSKIRIRRILYLAIIAYTYVITFPNDIKDEKEFYANFIVSSIRTAIFHFTRLSSTLVKNQY